MNSNKKRYEDIQFHAPYRVSSLLIRRASSAAVTIAALALVGCGVSTNVQNAPPPTAKTVSIAFQPTPPTSVAINGTAQLTASVSNDPSNAGVDWTLTCQARANCGSLAAPHTSSGQAQTYTPPLVISSNNQSVSIVAFATADHTKNMQASVDITAFGNVLNGTYVIQTSGVDTGGNPYQRAGAIILDGNGNVTSGERTVDFVNPNTGVISSVTDPVIGGSYFIGPDGRGTIAIETADASVGQQATCQVQAGPVSCGIENFSLVVLSNAQVLLTKIDDSTISALSGESSTGSLDLQTSVVAPAQGYAFVTRGMDNTATAVALGGIVNVNAPNTISGAGSIADFARNDGSGLITSPNSPVSGTVSAPDSFGAVQFSLTTGFAPIQFTGYLIDTSHIELIESDDNGGAGFALSAGMALGQGSATGTFTHLKAFAGNWVFGMYGPDNGGAFSFLSSAGIFTAGSGALSKGYIDLFHYQGSADLQISGPFHANYTIDTSGSGRVDTNSSFIFNQKVNGTGPELVFYLTGNGGPALVLDADIEPAVGGAGLATGIAYPLVSGATLAGTYGVSVNQNFSGTEADSVGEVTATSGNLSGILDMNIAFSPATDTSLTDGFQASSISGRLVGTWTDSVGFPTLSVAYYPIDSNHGFVTEIDGGQTGANPGSLTFGTYAPRTPVCQGCP